MAEFEKEHLVPLYKRLNELLAKNGNGFFVGKQVIFALMPQHFQKFPAVSSGSNVAVAAVG